MLHILRNVIYKNFVDNISFGYYKALNLLRKFTFQGKKFRYLIHKYNFTWRNERSVEIPIIRDIVLKNRNLKILEVGNVLSHYYKINHDILDKYEVAPEVINEDVVSYNPKQKYDLIVSISTFEHVGWDEKPRENYKIRPAISNLRSILSKNGKIIFTVPIGYNKHFDEMVKKNKLNLTSSSFLKRTSRLNKWEECSYKEIFNFKYNYPFGNANAIMVATIVK